MFKWIFMFSLIIIFSFLTTIQGHSDTNGEIENIPATTQITTESLPPFNKLILKNDLFPGYAQNKMGYKKEAKLYYLYWPLYAAGTTLSVLYLWNQLDAVQDENINWVYEDNRNYMFKHEVFQTNNQRWMMYAGTACLLAATLLSTYSEYAAVKDYEDIAAGRTPDRYTLGDLLKAPYQKEVVFNTKFFPMYPLSVVLQFRVNDYAKIGNFFRRETVPFLGAQVNPWAGLGLAMASTFLFVTMNATWEEIAFRGVLLEERGLASSSLWFGSAHLLNFMYPNVSMEDTALQTIFAGLYGFYLGKITEENNYDFRTAIALHFWHNVTTMVLDYLINPEDNMIFSVGFNLEF